MQRVVAGNRTQNHGDKKGVEAEDYTVFAGLFEIVHIDFKTGQKHQVEDTYVAEYFETAVAGQQVKAVGPDDDTGDDKPDDVGNSYAIEQYGCKQYDYQYDEKYQPRIFNRQSRDATHDSDIFKMLKL